MARYRTIKPEFWTSEQVMECSTNARLMFIGMWNFADDTGRLPLSAKAIKAQIFPSDDITSENIRGMIDELSANALVVIYAVDNKEYLQITGWHHQKIDKPQKPKYPPPPPEPQNDSTNVRRMVAPERKKEESGKKEQDADAARSAPPELETELPLSDEADYFRRFKKTCGPTSGGLAKKLLVAKGNVIALALSVVLQASTKGDPREYIGRIISGSAKGEQGAMARPGYGDEWG